MLKGCETLINLFGISSEDLEFVGRIFELENNIKVCKVEVNSNNITYFKVHLNKGVDKTEILCLLNCVGLEYPDYEKKTKYGYYFNVGGRAIRFYI